MELRGKQSRAKGKVKKVDDYRESKAGGKAGG